jgi:transcriptional regulator with XRE-family HTH domain
MIGAMKRAPSILQRFGLRIRQLRQAQGYSQEEFAGHCGLDRTYVSGIERGLRNVSLKNIELLAKTLKTPLSELFQGL